MVLKSLENWKRWMLICLVPFLGGFGAVCAVSLKLNGRFDDNDKKGMNLAPVVITLLASIVVFVVFLLVKWNSTWQLIIALGITLYIAGYGSLLYVKKYVKKNQENFLTEETKRNDK